MKSRFFTIQRKILESKMWLSEKFTKGQAWVDLIGLANWADSNATIRGIKFQVKRGQVARSERFLTQRWGWSRNRVRRFLYDLENEQQIEKKMPEKAIPQNPKNDTPNTSKVIPQTIPQKNKDRKSVV